MSGAKTEPLLKPTGESHAEPASDDDVTEMHTYRRLLFLTVLCDAATIFSIAAVLDGREAFLTAHYTFSTSSADVVWLLVLRVIAVCTATIYPGEICCSCDKVKVAGYGAMLQVLMLGIKACIFERWGEPLAAALLASAIGYTVLEGMLAFMTGLFDTRKAAEADEATTASSQGINVDGHKELSLCQLLKVLEPYFWPAGCFNKLCVLATWACLGVSKAANIIAPLYIADATDELTGHGDLTKVTVYCILYASLLLVNKAFKELQSLSYIRVKLVAGLQLQETTYTHLHRLSMDWHQRKQMGTVVKAMDRGVSASNSVVQYLFMTLLPTLVEACVICAVFVAEFEVPVLAGCAFSGVALYMAVTIELTLWRMKFRKRMNKADNDAHHKATDALMNFEAVKYFTAELHEVGRFVSSISTVQSETYRIQLSLSFLNCTQQAILNGTLVSALLVMAHNVAVDGATVGKFVAVTVYVNQLFTPLSFLGTIYSSVLGAFVDLQNLSSILAEKPDIEDLPGAIELKPAADGVGVEFRGVCFSYPSRPEVKALDNVSFRVPPGTTTAIVGETGAGKSSITRMLFRFFEADKGEVLVGGSNVMKVTQRSLRTVIGMVPQDHILFNDTLRYNIHYGDLTKPDSAVEAAAEGAQLVEFVDDLPQGWETQVGERGQQVSGGQKQRIAIARVLVKDPPVVVLDEATSNLDSQTEEKVQTALQQLGLRRTMIIIAHRLSTIQHADQIIVMSHGTVLEQGAHHELLGKGQWHERCYASLWAKQAKSDHS